MRLLKDLLSNFLEWSFERKANKMFLKAHTRRIIMPRMGTNETIRKKTKPR